MTKKPGYPVDLNEPRCANCRFAHSDWAEPTETRVLCRRHAPPPHREGKEWTWPAIDRWNWCGDYERDPNSD